MSVITDTKLEFAKLGSRIGAEIRGFDLSGELSPETVGQIRAALNEHKALVFREANILSDEAQVKFASHFGPLTTAHPTVASVEGEENVLPSRSWSTRRRLPPCEASTFRPTVAKP
jgi:alpha-ketoglutarate-dependent sulfate ester dioxygenase